MKNMFSRPIFSEELHQQPLYRAVSFSERNRPLPCCWAAVYFLLLKDS